ncbi:hypothetical protein L3Y34_005883 [Caenorhabditis briggsae]|uniref:Uncharacterized protein n=1 Tax=Caenorhabditis briggsae TaxID=6238 RepID=A0AAE8ZZP7_CAEBR|nr:hypothetical protein L3Y34_005883 [Caenorhabditis briggsae]
MNTSLSFAAYSKTGNLTFMAKYSYLDLTHYQQVVKPTGAYFNTTLETGKYYTVKASTAEDQVNLHYGSRENGFVDHTVFEVFLFDGNDIVNSKYIGRVSSVFFRRYEFVSTSNTLTLLNLYNTPSDSLFLGNDASVIEPMDVYSIFVLDSDQDLDSWMGQVEEPFKKFDAWYTVICNGCSSFAINYMMFEANWGYGNPNGYVAIQGMTPTDKLKPVLTYPYSTNNNASFPQLITAPIATFHLFNASVHFNLSPGSQQQDFETSPGESRSIYSPQLWNPDATPSFDYTFSDPLAVYNFSIRLNTLALENDGDELDVEVGSVNGLTTLEKKYTKTKLTNEVISGLGKYLKLKYTGSKTSEVDLSFLMIDPSNPDGTTQSPGSTNSDTTVSTSVGTSVSTSATRVSTSTIAPVTSTEVTSTSRPSTSVGTTQSVATVASTSTRDSTSARVSTSTRTHTSTVDITYVASSTLAPSTSTAIVTFTKVSSSTNLQTSTTETSTSALSTSTIIIAPSYTATTVVTSTTSVPRTTFISTTSEVHTSTIAPESSSTSSVASASVTTSTFLPSSTTGMTFNTSTVTTPTTSTEAPTTSKLITSTSTDVPTTSTSEPPTTTLITTKLTTYTASPSTLNPTNGIVSTTVTTPITSTEAPTTLKTISSTTTLLTTSTASPTPSTITTLLPTSTKIVPTTKPTADKPSSSTITSLASTSASTQSKQATSSRMSSSSSAQKISTESSQKSTVVVQTTEPIITQSPVVPIIVSTLAPSPTTRASRTQTSDLSTVQTSSGSTQSTQSTQTTPINVETTTAGAASLLPTGLLILVISNIFF